jgi:crotonobetainyl-CoA:carnitine CoA-transferase CaiB-like acyl-CoA transferase
VTAPVQFDETPAELAPAPELGAQTEQILLELGYSWDDILALKDENAVT